MAGWNYIIVIQLNEAIHIMPSDLYDIAFDAVQELPFSMQHGLYFQKSTDEFDISDNKEEGQWHEFAFELDHKKSNSSLSLKFFIYVVVLNNRCKYISMVGDTTDSDLFLKNNIKDLANGLMSVLGANIIKIIADPYGDLDQTYTEMMVDEKFEVIYKK